MTKTSRSSSSTGPRQASKTAESFAPSPLFDRWFDRTWSRALQDLTFSELRRSVQALSRRYVQDRGSLERGGALESAGKRAAFAAFYAPLHLHAVAALVRSLGWDSTGEIREIVDLGCGTGAAGAGWLEAGHRPATIEGIDRNGWALGVARETWSAFGARGRTRKTSLETARLPGRSEAAIVAAWTVNELSDDIRSAALERLRKAAAAGSRVLVIEPISRRAAPWWDEWERAAAADGGKACEWTLEPRLPAAWWDMDRAARLDHRRIKLRTLCWPAAPPPARA